MMRREKLRECVLAAGTGGGAGGGPL